MKYEKGDQIDPAPREKVPSKSPALLGLKRLWIIKVRFNVIKTAATKLDTTQKLVNLKRKYRTMINILLLFDSLDLKLK